MRARVKQPKDPADSRPRRRRGPDGAGPPSPLLDDALAERLAAAARDPALLRTDPAPRTGPVYVTQPFLPPFAEFAPMLREIWDRKVLTNGGPCHAEFEERLAAYLGVPHVALFNNATTALVVALRALGLTGEVVTTPYSFVATSHALTWGGLTPVFADIDPRTLNLDPAAVEAAITPRTRAIMPVHCYGHPCDVEGLAAVARRHGLRIVYDAAHAFGVRDAAGSILRHGDLSVLSFHATKVFNTFEGGAIVCPDARRKDQIDKLKNFGHDGETSVIDVGLNGKMSEFNAALGLLQLRYIDSAIDRRAVIDAAYRAGLAGIAGLACLDGSGEARANFSYFPVLVGPGYPVARDALWEILKAEGIHTRRYFHPLISDHPMYAGLPSADRSRLPVASQAADRILCLPIYPDLEPEVVARVIARIADPLGR
ncbi:DegT/DnrJ/EryC1/StrS family aminotransferase [Methylobacterium sp. J-076]|uniref:DegT/DnrJ/EryC1/StrS family aminotransferase n=1 Tax=Methylobacterium sp. J-076 TaxID=2836655 RepID=UPI001FB9A91E|nr:DegT/DnrJ/EryC1/StrS family aminotransferase [Methylobacterium sp. J-076]MCJ2015714.1 DegT/DnrJ/EryC1/StrS family aminotransferase [Methylobacterium sp. J-076]